MKFCSLLYRYRLPKAEGVEKVHIERIRMRDDSAKREIYVMSDLHLGGKWSKDIKPRLDEFFSKLRKLAKHSIHSIILLGDVLEMWMTPITITPPTPKEFLEIWKKDEVKIYFYLFSILTLAIIIKHIIYNNIFRN